MSDRLSEIAYIRNMLLAEEMRLAAALSSVRSKLNALQPVSCLPSEILEEIFDVCVSWLYGHHKPKHRLAWTQVCCSWRQISLNSSRLWQRIDLCDSRFADEFLVRSKEAPLSIVSASPLKLTTDNLALHINRLRCIDVFLFSDDMVRLFTSIGPTLSTAMTHLSLKVPSKSSPLALDVDIPFVHHLALDCVAIKWHTCQNLVHLSVRGLSPECCPSITELHDILEASPNLEFVRLENLTPPTLATESRRPISLIHLTDMIISAQPNIVSAILASLLLGPSTRLQLFASLSESLHTLFPSGLPYLHGAARSSTGTVRLSRHSAHFLRHGSPAWSETSAQTLFSISSAPPLSTRVCASLAHLLDLNCVTRLELNTGMLFDIPLAVLAALLTGLRSVATLCVAFNELADLLWILQGHVQDASRDGGPGAVPRVCLPRLRTLAFSKPSDLWYHFSDRWLEPTVACAQARCLLGAPFETLEFYRCNGISPESTARLKEFVGEVAIYPEGRHQTQF